MWQPYWRNISGCEMKWNELTTTFLPKEISVRQSHSRAEHVPRMCNFVAGNLIHNYACIRFRLGCPAPPTIAMNVSCSRTKNDAKIKDPYVVKVVRELIVLEKKCEFYVTKTQKRNENCHAMSVYDW